MENIKKNFHKKKVIKLNRILEVYNM